MHLQTPRDIVIYWNEDDICSEIGGKVKEMLRKLIFIVLHPNRVTILSPYFTISNV